MIKFDDYKCHRNNKSMEDAGMFFNLNKNGVIYPVYSICQKSKNVLHN